MYVEAYETLSESLLQHALCRVCNRSLYIIMQHRLHAFGHRVVSCWVRPRPRRSAPRIATSSSLVRSNNGSPRFTDFPSLCACSESSLTNLIGSGLNLLFTNPFKTGMSLDLARGRDSWCWPKEAPPLGKKMCWVLKVEPVGMPCARLPAAVQERSPRSYPGEERRPDTRERRKSSQGLPRCNIVARIF